MMSNDGLVIAIAYARVRTSVILLIWVESRLHVLLVVFYWPRAAAAGLPVTFPKRENKKHLLIASAKNAIAYRLSQKLCQN